MSIRYVNRETKKSWKKQENYYDKWIASEYIAIKSWNW